jgi:23S rRNA G2445 N2-methylase RlmL
MVGNRVAERFKLELISFECTAEGEVEEFLDQTSWFKTVTLRPHLKVRNSSEKVVLRALNMARKYSTIAQSVKSQIVIEPIIEIV